MEIVPFGGLRVSTSTADEELISNLLDDSRQKRVKCGICGGSALKLEALVKMNLDVSFGKIDRQILVREKKPDTAMVLRVLECATCGASDDFIIKDKGT